MSQLPDSIKQKIQQRKNQNAGSNATEGFGEGVNSGAGGGTYAQNRALTPGSHFRVWVVYGKQIKPASVLIGLSDGTNTQVQGDLKEGDEVAVGTLTQVAAQQSNPFAGGGRRY